MFHSSATVNCVCVICCFVLLFVSYVQYISCVCWTSADLLHGPYIDNLQVSRAYNIVFHCTMCKHRYNFRILETIALGVLAGTLYPSNLINLLCAISVCFKCWNSLVAIAHMTFGYLTYKSLNRLTYALFFHFLHMF